MSELREHIHCTDESGRSVIVCRYASTIRGAEIGGSTDAFEGTSTYYTEGDEKVERTDDRTFTIVTTKDVLTRSD